MHTLCSHAKTEPHLQLPLRPKRRFFFSMGKETVVWGPGSIDVAHQPNEFIVDEAELHATVEHLEALIRRYCTISGFEKATGRESPST